jgi:hypothetical protein
VRSRCHAQIAFWAVIGTVALLYGRSRVTDATYTMQNPIKLWSGLTRPPYRSDALCRDPSFPTSKLCVRLALLHEAVLGRPAQWLAVAAHSLWLASVLLTLLDERRLCRPRERLPVLGHGLSFASALRK